MKRTSWRKPLIPITKEKSGDQNNGALVTYKGIRFRVIADFPSAPLGD